MQKLIANILIFTIITSIASAQVFDADITGPAKTQKTVNKPVPSFIMPSAEPAQKKENQEEKLSKKTQRGSSVIRLERQKGEENLEPPNVIFLSMTDFNVLRLGSKNVTCTMNFSIITNLPEVLNSIDLQLTWPSIGTSISFSNVVPNQSTYLEYGLLGEGCLSMDSAPNIEVNRCRVKGLSQEECAEAIRWIE